MPRSSGHATGLLRVPSRYLPTLAMPTAWRGTTVEPVPCGLVGAYRHVIGIQPVLGPASVAIKLAGGGALDSVSVQVRETSGERIEWAPIVRPEVAARQVVMQLGSLMGRSKVPFVEL